MARVHRQLVAMLHDTDDRIDIGEIEPGIDALGIQVERECYEVHVAGTLAVAEQATLDAIGAGHDGKFGCRHRTPSVVMRMHRQHNAVAIGHVAAEPLDLVGVHIRGGHFHRCRQIQDRLTLRRWLPHRVNRVADFHREIQFGAGKALGRILEDPVRVGLLFCALQHDSRSLHRNVHDARLVEAEHDTPLHRRSRVIQMHDGALCAAQGFESAADQRFARLGQHLHRHIIGNQFLLDELAHEIEIGLGRGGKSDLDFLEPGFQQQHEHAQLALRIHGFDQRLVAVAQIDAAPDRRTGDDLARPGAVGQGDRGKRTVFLRRVWVHVVYSRNLMSHNRLTTCLAGLGTAGWELVYVRAGRSSRPVSRLLTKKRSNWPC